MRERIRYLGRILILISFYYDLTFECSNIKRLGVVNWHANLKTNFKLLGDLVGLFLKYSFWDELDFNIR